MKFLRFQEVELQALVNASRQRQGRKRLIPLRLISRRLVPPLSPTDWKSAGNPESCRRILLCPQSPPNRFLCSPLCPSQKATAWVFAFADHFYRPPARTSISIPNLPRQERLGLLFITFYSSIPVANHHKHSRHSGNTSRKQCSEDCGKWRNCTLYPRLAP